MKRAWIVVLLLAGCSGTGTLEKATEVSTAVDGLIDSTHKLQEALRVTEKQRDEFMAQIQEDAKTIQAQNKLIKQLEGSLGQSIAVLKESIGQTKEAIRQRDRQEIPASPVACGIVDGKVMNCVGGGSNWNCNPTGTVCY